MEGSGLYTYASGDMYQGQFKGGKRHGQGMYHYKVGAPGACGLHTDMGARAGRVPLKGGATGGMWAAVQGDSGRECTTTRRVHRACGLPYMRARAGRAPL